MIKVIDVKEMESLVASGAQLVDVREADELQGGVISGFIHMPLSSFESFQDQISKSRPTVFYCRSGRRSLTAATMAEQWTSQPLYSLAGGYLGYSGQC